MAPVPPPPNLSYRGPNLGDYELQKCIFFGYAIPLRSIPIVFGTQSIDTVSSGYTPVHPKRAQMQPSIPLASLGNRE